MLVRYKNILNTNGSGADEEVGHGKVRVEEAAGDGAPEVRVPGHIVPAPEGAPHRGHQTPANCVEHELENDKYLSFWVMLKIVY